MRSGNHRVRNLARLAAAVALVGLGTTVAIAPLAHADGPMTITAPDIIFGPSTNPGTPIPLNIVDPISDDDRHIIIGNYPPNADQCAPTSGNDFAFTNCSTAKLELNGHGTLEMPGLTQQAFPHDDIWVAASGAVLNQKVATIFNINGTPDQIKAALDATTIVPDDDYETTDDTPMTLTINATPQHPDFTTADTHQVTVRVEGENDWPDVTIPSGPFDVQAGTDPGYTSSRGQLDDPHDDDWDIDGDDDFDQDESDDIGLLVMVATCGEFELIAGLPYVDDIENLLTANNMLDLPDEAADAIIAVLPDEVANGTFGTASPNNQFLSAFAGAGTLDEIDAALEIVEFRDLDDNETCHLFTFISDLGNNGMPLKYIGSPPTGFGIPIPSVSLSDTVFVVGAGSTPTATIEQASGQSDPTSTAPIHFTLTFDTDVTGVTAADIDLSASTAGGTLTPTVTGGPAVYDVAVSGMTTAGGVVAKVGAGAANAVDPPNNPSAAATSVDNTVTWLDTVGSSVVVDQAAGQADPTSTSPIEFTVTFSEPVTGFDDSDVSFTGSTAGGTLTPAVSGGPSVYTVAVSGMTTDGNVVVSVPAGAALDGSNNPSVASTAIDNVVAWEAVDTTAPSVTIDQAAGQADPTSALPIEFTAVFSEPVTGFDDSDVSFAGSTVGGTLAAAVSGGPSTYTVSVTGMTTDGDVVATVLAGAATDGTNASTASTSTDNTVTWEENPPPDVTVPSVTIDQAAGQSDPTSVSPIQFTVVFSEPVTGFTSSDVTFTGSTAGGTLAAAVAGGPSTYTVSVTGMTTSGTVVAALPAGAATDGTNASAASTSTDNTVTWVAAPPDVTVPSVTIDQAAGQSDPTSVSPIQFTVVFSEAVSGFTAADVDLSASTAGGSLSAAVSGGPSTYTVAVSGMTTDGDVIATIPAGAATDGTNPSAASTSTDDTVTWQAPPPADATPPTVTIDQAAGQADPTATTPIQFTVVFSEPVTGFDGSDVQLSGSAGATTAVVSGGPSTYTVTVSGMVASGEVIATIPAGAATDGTNASLASTSTDDTVTFELVPGDNAAPDLTVPADITVFNDPGQAGAVVDYPAPTAIDATPPVTITCTSPSGAFYPLGVTTVSCTATDSAPEQLSLDAHVLANSITKSFTITVIDNEPPVIDQPPDITVTGTAAGAIVSFTNPSASDNSGVVPTVSCAPGSGGTFPVGSTTITCTATDGAGNSASATFRIIVIEGSTTLPTTGADATVWIRWAALLVAAGAMAVVMVRRRRTAVG